ncbi:hypothetical protein [uncultured Sphingopyxis sp.]|jgi:hypothetical protein|uniref:hypothetical protein n=1 Tax=uncultured Sphingopyxis sp. TaxID=310581 RepID=UPI0025924A40|nr:hypothetical protein [uncultured Sphingopyxis sp.]
MANVKIPGLVARRSKTAGTSWYWQPSKTLRDAGFTPEPLGKDEGKAIARAQELNAQVAQWKKGKTLPQIRTRKMEGTLGHAIDLYRRDYIGGRDADGKPLVAASTAKTYRTGLKYLEAWAGRQPLAYITPGRVTQLRKAIARPVDQGGIGKHSAHNTLKMGRQLFAFLISEDRWPKGANPFEDFGMGQPAPRDVVWSPTARELMITTAYDLGFPSIALAIQLGYAIGQREADILALTHRQFTVLPEHKMQPEDYRVLAALSPDGIPRGIRIRQNKTGAWIEVPVVGNVRWSIEANIETARQRGAATILLDDTRSAGNTAAIYHGKAGQTRFQRDFAEIREWARAAALFEGEEDLAAELARIQFLDLRRTCVVYLGELGLEDHLIAAITGHDIDETRRILKVYMPRTTGRAARAIALASVRAVQEAEREKAG